MNLSQSIDPETRRYRHMPPLPVQHGAPLGTLRHERRIVPYKVRIERKRATLAPVGRPGTTRSAITDAIAAAPAGLTMREMIAATRLLRTSLSGMITKMLDAKQIVACGGRQGSGKKTGRVYRLCK